MTSWPAFANVNPKVYESWRIAPALRPLKQDVVGKVGDTLWVLMGTLAIVMFIACANVATLLLVRAEAGTRNSRSARRSARDRARIVRALLVESVLLGFIGGAFGLALASAGLRALVALAPAGLPRVAEIAIDPARSGVQRWRSRCVSGVVFGLIPALKHASPQIAAALATGGRRSGPAGAGTAREIVWSSHSSLLRSCCSSAPD